MKIHVLSEPDAWHFMDLVRAAGGRHQLIAMPFEQLSAVVNGRHELESSDVILTRAMPAGSLEQVVFRMDVLLELERRGALIVNPPRAVEAAVDKYLSLAKLAASGLPVPETRVSQSIAQAMSDFEALGGDVVCKPIFGSMGFGIIRLKSAGQAKRVFSDLIEQGHVIYLQELLDHQGRDLRLLVIGERIFSMARSNPGQLVTNVSRGGVGLKIEVGSNELQLARQAATSVGASIAGVDLVFDERLGRTVIVEINSAPAWKAIAKTIDVDIAAEILTHLEWAVQNRGCITPNSIST